MSTQAELAARLRAIVRSTPWCMQVLHAVAQLGLPDCCIGAGAVRNLVWDALHGYAHPSALSDVDVAYFDAHDSSPEIETQLRQRLATLLPGVPWEVCNQARVHLWFEDEFGYAVPPLLSLDDAIATWPEFATSVGIYLQPDGEIGIVAPHGLDDLFNMVVRRNPARISLDGYAQRLASKDYAARWPRVTIISQASDGVKRN
ncbi:nucleotidyltransferase family protein [Janthinobacterium lividum]|uniref:Nucleotidyltransferase family protein n=1 Tax=Janthinobacterium lividum TaxID=29581 RepID=A0ABU0XXA5_9BURK|nr:nucleotidyltransferase family protein [Janthinobacterium lividum]MDQ4627504.1 nucleotidyltransferase family protein [Janthinobacterium lividum]MDQ4675732.1 nucleotidyltransferase family protein [Janthinobacterium lividum]MDQ4686462.1 nucleotidyltransferase family protein [Janthinobacterium lividum]